MSVANANAAVEAARSLVDAYAQETRTDLGTMNQYFSDFADGETSNWGSLTKETYAAYLDAKTNLVNSGFDASDVTIDNPLLTTHTAEDSSVTTYVQSGTTLGYNYNKIAEHLITLTAPTSTDASMSLWGGPVEDLYMSLTGLMNGSVTFGDLEAVSDAEAALNYEAERALASLKQLQAYKEHGAKGYRFPNSKPALKAALIDIELITKYGEQRGKTFSGYIEKLSSAFKIGLSKYAELLNAENDFTMDLLKLMWQQAGLEINLKTLEAKLDLLVSKADTVTKIKGFKEEITNRLAKAEAAFELAKVTWEVDITKAATIAKHELTIAQMQLVKEVGMAGLPNDQRIQLVTAFATKIDDILRTEQACLSSLRSQSYEKAAYIDKFENIMQKAYATLGQTAMSITNDK